MTIPGARRLLALLLSLSVLHLMAGSDASCASHAMGAAAGAMGQAGMHEAAMSGMHAGAGAGSRMAQAPQECAAPMPDRCCEAMSSCGVTIHCRSAAARDAAPALARASMPANAVMLLASIDTAPEPPPPKA